MEDKKNAMDSRHEDLSKETKTLIDSLPPQNKSIVTINLCKYQGCWYSQTTLEGVLKFERNFKPQDTDIIVASFPKCGTTWLKALTFAIVHRSKHSPKDQHHPLLFDNPHTLVPYFEMNLYDNNKNPNKTNSSSSPRLFSTHMPWHTLQEGLKGSPCKIVYVSRNVKDALVSYWHFFRGKEINGEIICGIEGTFESFCKGVNFFGPFWEHVLSYWNESLKHPKHVLFMRYEELKAEPHEQIKRLAEFLGFPFTEEEEENGMVDEILDLCSLRNLSNLEINKTGALLDQDYKTFFRKGEVNDWKNYLTPEMANQIDMIIQEKFQNSECFYL